MRWLLGSLFVVLICGCGTMTPTASVTPTGAPATAVSPTPTPALSGAVAMTGAVDVRFEYATPVACAIAGKQMSLTLATARSGQLMLQLQANPQVGTYGVDPTNASAPKVVYQGPLGVFNARSRTVSVISGDGHLYTGAVDVSMSSLASLTAHASGSWACRLP